MAKSGEKVLIIGGGSGIGFAVAEAALAAGAHVTIASSNAGRIGKAAEALGANGIALDVKDEGAVERFFAGSDGFDHIVFTAGDWGGPRRGPLAELDLAAAARLFDVRFWGALAVAKHGARTLSLGGSLTLTSGMIAHKPNKGSAVSTGMAGAVEHLTRGLAMELSPVRVNCVCLGIIRTGVWDFIPEGQREAQLAEMTKRLMLPRAGTPEEAAEAYLHLMRAGYTTGQVLFVEGGAV